MCSGKTLQAMFIRINNERLTTVDQAYNQDLERLGSGLKYYAPLFGLTQLLSC